MDHDICWVAGRAGTILSTTNGGRNWDYLKFKKGTDLWAVSFVDRRVGWIVGRDSVILKTIDGGKSWVGLDECMLKSRLEKQGAFFFDAVKFFDANLGCIADGNIIFCTRDGGVSWSQSKTEAIHFIGFAQDGEKLLAVEQCAERDFVSMDQGRTWQRKNPK